MKNQIAIVALALFIFASCSKESTPEEITRDFVSQLSEGNCDAAKNLTTGEVTEYIDKVAGEDCANFTSTIKDIKCESTEETAKCDCEEEREGKIKAFTYYFIKQEGQWKISNIEGEAEPEDVVEEFVNALAKGDCDLAAELSTGDASETVQATMHAGCTAYFSEIASVECETTGETANCKCIEERDGINMTYGYDLEQVDGEWKVASYAKDLGLDGMEDISFE